MDDDVAVGRGTNRRHDECPTRRRTVRHPEAALCDEQLPSQ
jgi:hypothetical protein